MQTETAGLNSLSDDLLLDIVEHLDTARDAARLGSSWRRAHNLMHQLGWKAFVRTRFPSLTFPSDDSTRWSSVADRLTYLDRCWEKRGFMSHFFQEESQGHPRNRRRQGRQSVRFQSVVDAHLLSSLQEELVACGAGEDLFVRWRAANGKRPDAWRHLVGRETGFLPGTGDVTAVSAIERNSRPEVIVGRANGDVQLLSAGAGLAAAAANDDDDDEDDDAFGQPAKRLLAPDHGASSLKSSPGRLAVTWTEWHPETQVMASCRSSLLTLYNLSSDDETDLKPVACYDASRADGRGDVPLVRCAKFMNNDVIACGIGGSHEPLRWGKIRPTGLELFPATLQDRLDEYSEQRQTVRAIERVGGSGNGNLLLSAWDDGGYRLLDMRTRSGQVVMYRDRFQPYHAASSLLVYGSERFIAGGNSEPVLRCFDFRNPKPYYHFSALPCSDQPPAPEPPEVTRTRNKEHGSTKPSREPARCDAGARVTCNWHAQSMQPRWRPDATVYLGGYAHDRVFSLAKASDVSGSLYCGLRGAVVEMTLALAEDMNRADVTPTAPRSWTVKRGERALWRIAVMETGVSRYHSDGWSGTAPMASVGLYSHHPPGSSEQSLVGAPERSRLDSSNRRRGEPLQLRRHS